MTKVRTAILVGMLTAGASGIAHAQTSPSTSTPSSSTQNTAASPDNRPPNFPPEPQGNVLFCAVAGSEKKCITIAARDLPAVSANPHLFVKLPPPPPKR